MAMEMAVAARPPARGTMNRPSASWARVILRLAATAALLTAVGLAGGAQAAGEATPQRLSLEEAVALGFKNSPDLELARLGVDKARVGLDQARATAYDIKSDAVFTLDPLAKLKDVAPRQAEMALKLAQKGVDATTDNLRLGIVQAYFGAVLAADLAGVREQAVALAEEQVRQAKVGVKAGTRARTDVLAAEAQLATARADLAAAKKDREVAAMGLDRTLGLPLDARPVLTTPLAFTPRSAPDATDLAKAIDRGMKRSTNILQAEETLAVARLTDEVTARYMTSNTYVYQQAFLDLKQAQVRLAAARTALEADVRTALLDATSAAERVAQQKKALELSEETLRLAQLRYRAGVGTNAEVLDAQVRVSGARSALSGAINAHQLAWARYDNLAGDR